MNELNEALLWLAERQGRISFSVDAGDRPKALDHPVVVINVEAKIVTAEDDSEFELRHCSIRVCAGNVVDALLAAINSARGYGHSIDTMVDDGDPNTD